jgi:Na+-translocating ferredoxin:NAD+ oxidoreductase subunit E
MMQTLLIDGLWRNNPGLVQLLGLCPLMAVSTSVENALGLGLATLVALAVSSLLVCWLKPITRPETRIALFVVIIAATVSAIELLMKAYAHDLYQVLGLFLPLIVTNCAIIGRAEAFASRARPIDAFLDGVFMGSGFLLALLMVGAIREFIGQSVLLAILPPGGFFVLAALIAGKNGLEQWRAKRLATYESKVPA